MSFTISNDTTISELLSIVMPRWAEEARKAFERRALEFSSNITTTEDLRMLLVASPGSKSGPTPTLWFPFCEHMQERVSVFDRMAQHCLKVKLSDKRAPTLPSNDLEQAAAPSADTHTTPKQTVQVDLFQLCGILRQRGPQTEAEHEDKRRKVAKSRDLEIRTLEEFLDTDFSRQIF